jgi:SAM-dependent methyltransferase
VITALFNRASGAAAARGPSPKPPLGERFKAWWEGYELVLPQADASEGARAEPQAAAAPEAAPEPKPEKRVWNDERVTATEVIWGDGFIWPGAEEYFLNLVKPFGLTPAMSVLDLSAGLGGGTRALASSFGVWVEGLEASLRLAEQAMEKSTMAGLSKKAPVRHYDPETVELPKGKYDCVLSRESFFGVLNKEKLLKSVERALKDKGQIIFTDYVLRSTKLESNAVTAWKDKEPNVIWPYSVDEYTALLGGLGLEMRICDDMTENYRALIMSGWGHFMNMLKDTKLPPKVMLEVVSEAELWLARMKAFDSGDVRLYRFHLLKKKPSLMSNW